MPSLGFTGAATCSLGQTGPCTLQWLSAACSHRSQSSRCLLPEAGAGTELPRGPGAQLLESSPTSHPRPGRRQVLGVDVMATPPSLQGALCQVPPSPAGLQPGRLPRGAGGGGGLSIKVAVLSLSPIHSGPGLLGLQLPGLPGSVPEPRDMAWETSSSEGCHECSRQWPDRTIQNTCHPGPSGPDQGPSHFLPWWGTILIARNRFTLGMFRIRLG